MPKHLSKAWVDEYETAESGDSIIVTVQNGELPETYEDELNRVKRMVAKRRPDLVDKLVYVFQYLFETSPGKFEWFQKDKKGKFKKIIKFEE